jgi:hypothetical protein
MKLIPSLALAIAAVLAPFSSAAANRVTSSDAAAAVAITAADRKAQEAIPSLRGSSVTASLPSARPGRGLQQQVEDQTCYTKDITHHDDFAGFGDDSFTTTGVPCTAQILDACNHHSSCAVTQSEAVGFASQFCKTWTVWKGNWACKWEYMCCNAKGEEEEEEEPQKI